MAQPGSEQPGLEVRDEQPGLEVRGDQPGLEVPPEHEAPHALYGQGVQKPWGSHPTSPVHGGYSQPPYSPLYPPPPSHYGTDWNSHSPHDTGYMHPEKATRGTIMGIRKNKFWLIFGPLIAVLVVGLAVGLGVGLGSQSSGSDASSTASASPAPTIAAVTCPRDNGTTYNAKGQNFLALCNLDYNGGGGTTDIGSVQTTTFEECLVACASNSGCAGAGWGRMDGSTTCWLKSNLGSSQKADTAWFFGIRQ